jgi:hypothetical protein
MDIEQLKAQLNTKGWHISLQDNSTQWTCELLTGPSASWPAHQPRPRASAFTAREAVQAAIQLRGWMEAERKRGAA